MENIIVVRFLDVGKEISSKIIELALSSTERIDCWPVRETDYSFSGRQDICFEIIKSILTQYPEAKQNIYIRI